MAQAIKSRRPKVPAPATALQAIAAHQVAAQEAASGQATSALSSDNLAPTREAASSPDVQSDVIAAPAETVAAATEDMTTMATAASTTEATDKAQALFGDASNRFKTAFEKSGKMGEDMVEFAKGNVEAMIASARVAATASQTLSQEAADYGKKSLESATVAFKSFATVKSPTELFQLQSEFAKAQFDSAVAEASRLSETMMKLAGDIAQPLSNRYALAAEKIKANTGTL
ncbi:phasin family protein [uncultured Sphingomonas sp.]|uniref:phasin family protein n=1 Tax=uncultured Sphingomonas sp. TaxID=158754 RepID=UPI0025E456DF|nr:phasin family protein [uncultured Sphingomonas sp.]